MDKVKLNIEPIETKTIVVGSNKIEILLYLKYQTKFDIISDYIETLLAEEDILLGYFKAEGKLVAKIIMDNTNIDIGVNDDGKTIEYIYKSGIWRQVRDNLLDYDDLRQELEDALRLVLKDKYSGKQVFNEITKFVDGFINSDKVKELVKELDAGTKKVSKFFPNVKTDDGVIIPDELILGKIEEGKLIEEVTEKKTRKQKVKKF